jgi:hypothetical protein
MDEITLKALDDSIKHWEENVKARTPSDADVWSSGCALCTIFYAKKDECDGCPVKAVSGEDNCRNTPWDYARNALTGWRNVRALHESNIATQKDVADAKRRWVEAATAELNFLKAIRPIGV